MAYLQKQANIVSESLPVEKIYHPFICGPNDAIIKNLMKETGARINVPLPRVLKDEIVVSGDKDAVNKCKAAIMGIYQEKKHKCQTMSVQVRKFQHKHVVGPNGSYLQEILAYSGVSVEVPLPESPSETITLRGEQPKLRLALEMVCSKANGVIHAVVNAPEWLHKFIIGKKGENISRITQDCRKVLVEFLHGEDKIQVGGPQNEVMDAVAALQDKVNELESCMDFAEVEIEQQFHKHIIGNIRRITNETGVMIIIPLDADKSNIFRIEGDQKGVERAKKQIMEIASRMEKNTKKEVTIDQRFHNFFIDAKGKTIQGIRRQFNQVQITFPDQGKRSDIVTLRGPKNDVDKCALYLDKIAKELECQLDFAEIEIEQQFHKHIFGKCGAEIRRIINETGAMIHIPPDAENNPIIFIEGESKGVERAKQQLMELVSRLIREETKTRVDLPGKVSNSDVIAITGKKAYAEVAQAKIEKINNEQEKNTKKEVTIDQRFHKFFIDAKGKTIQGIRRQFNQVQTTFPDQGKRSDIVRLRGPRNDVDKCAVYHDKIAKGLIREKTKTRVDLPGKVSNSDVITITGKKAHVEVAQTKTAKINNEQFISETGKRQILIGEVSYKRGLRSFHCNVCNKKFSTKSRMKKHKRRYHKEVSPWNLFFPKMTGVRLYERDQKDNQRYVWSVCEKHDSRNGKLLHHKDFRRYDCNICDEEHLMKIEPWKHLRHQKDFRCNKCDEEYSEGRKTCQHLHCHKDISIYQCDICGKRFSTKREMKEHRRHKDIRPYQCNICDDGYSTQRDLWQHLRVHKDFRCNKCNDFDEEYPEKRQPWQHFPAYKDFRPIERVIQRWEALGYGRHCKKLTLYEIGGFQEILSKTEEGKLCKSCQCRFCRKRFSRNNEPEQDKNNQNEFRPHQFNIGGNRFSTKSGLEKHMRDHKDVRHYQCVICGKKFSTKKGMKDHKRCHVDVGRYQCDICGKKFSTRTVMEEHRRHHAGDLNHHKCDFCDEIFSTMNELEQHKNLHEDFRPYKCDVCSERFSTKNGMEQHKRHHKDIKPYQCSICEKKFTTKSGMEQHRQHHYGSMVLSKRQ